MLPLAMQAGSQENQNLKTKFLLILVQFGRENIMWA